MFREKILAVAVAAACSTAFADETTLSDIVVSATLSEHDSRTAPASVTVISREELATRNAADLLEAVRGAPGITLSPRQVGGRKTLALRGLEGKHTLTLIDGRRISPSDDVVGHSDYQYGWLPMSAVERIEIIRGPMSTLYGSEALGGVINLITRQPKDRWIGSTTLSGSDSIGNEGGSSGRASVFAAGPVTDRLSLRVTGERSHAGAVSLKEDSRYSELEGHDATTASVGATFQLTPEQSLDANWSQGKEDRFYNDVSGVKQYKNNYDIDRSQGHLAWRGEFAGWRGQVRAYRSEIDIVNSRTNGISATRPQNMSDQVLDGFAALKLDAHLLTLGGEFRDETLTNAGLVGGRDSATHKALFAQDEYAITNKLTLTAGVRADRHEIFGSELSPRAYLVWEATPELVIKGGYGHAFKAPTLKQISPNYIGAEGPHTFQGNANIQPEKSNSAEISMDWTRGPLSLRGTLFHNEVKDLITYRLIKVVGPRRSYLYDNVNKAGITGLESGFTWAINSSFDWNADLTLLKTRDRSSGKRLDDRPNASLSSHLDWRSGDGWSARGGFDLTGSQTSAGNRLPSYMMWNTSVARQLGKHVTLRASIDNLTDLRLAEKSPNFGYAERGRTLSVTLRADF